MPSSGRASPIPLPSPPLPRRSCWPGPRERRRAFYFRHEYGHSLRVAFFMPFRGGVEEGQGQDPLRSSCALPVHVETSERTPLSMSIQAGRCCFYLPVQRHGQALRSWARLLLHLSMPGKPDRDKSGAGRNGTEQSRAEQSRAEPNRTQQSGRLESRRGQGAGGTAGHCVSLSQRVMPTKKGGSRSYRPWFP